MKTKSVASLTDYTPSIDYYINQIATNTSVTTIAYRNKIAYNEVGCDCDIY